MMRGVQLDCATPGRLMAERTSAIQLECGPGGARHYVRHSRPYGIAVLAHFGRRDVDARPYGPGLIVLKQPVQVDGRPCVRQVLAFGEDELAPMVVRIAVPIASERPT